MKRRVLSLIIALALCLNLCPVWAFAADEGTDDGLCPHHPAHTDECGYVPESPDALCDEPAADEQQQADLSPCTSLQEQLDGVGSAAPSGEGDENGEPGGSGESGDPGDSTVDEGTDGGLCPHHPAHTDECGYVPESPDAPCAFACQVCPVQDLIGKLPDSVSEDNSEQVLAQLSEICDLYAELTADEQQQVDLSPCISLLEQLTGTGPAVLSDVPDPFYILEEDFGYPDPYEVSSLLKFDTNGHTFTGTGSSAIQVNGTGKLYLTGTVVSPNGTGAEVRPDGFLSITEPNTTITGNTYALDIAAGAEVHLSSGTYIGRNAAIRTADGNLAALLEPGYAFFDDSGTPLLPADAKWAQVIVVGPCPGHLGKAYSHTPGTTAHTWSCPYCVMGETEPCTFAFGQSGDGACNFCGNTITIAVDAGNLTKLVYDGTMKPENVSIKVTLTDGSGKELVKDTDYEVDYTPQKDAGEITVTVTGITFNGTFTKTYHVEQDQPTLEWDTQTKPAPIAVNYDGSPVEANDLPPVKIGINSQYDDLQEYLQYSYKKSMDSTYTDGLPTNVGTYDVVVSLPEMPNFHAVASEPITLTINKIPAVTTAPTAKTLTYSREAQKLVTAGILKPGAAAEGAKIEFAAAQGGSYSTDIPTGIGVSSYNVYYRVGETENYSGVPETLIKNPDTTYPSARINHKEITPTVELSYYTAVYTGGNMEPKVTVKDGEYEIPISEYTVAYANNKNVGTATVKVTNKANGNYTIKNPGVTVEFKITAQPQAALSIANQPNTVIYGDTFTLGTQGGSGSGAVTWKITVGNNVATVDAGSGQVTVTGVGSVTVQATKSGKAPGSNIANYDDATASWTFSVKKKPVTVTVTADEKPYDGSKTATLHAAFKTGDLVGNDSIPLTVEGEFVSADVGDSKTVTITKKEAGGASGKYLITWPDSTTASIYKVDAKIENSPGAADLTYKKDEAQALLTGGSTKDGIGTIVYSTSQNGAYSTDIPTGTNAGTYTVWYKVADSVNYTGIPAVEVTVEIKKAEPEITSNSLAADMVGKPLSEIPLEDIVSADVDGTFAWKDDSATVESEKSYDVIFTPDDKDNYNTVTVQVQVTIPEPPDPEPEQPEPGGSTSSIPSSRPGTSSAAANTLSTPAQTATTVRNGTASTVISAADGSKLVQEAVENRSRNVVIKPEIAGDVTKAAVSIPSSTVSRLGSETDAALTVSSPVADVTIPNAALGALSRAGGTVDVVTEQVEQSVVLTLAAGGEPVEQVPGGLTLAVPVEDAGPGTVAVLVHDDGTRETVRKSVVEDGVMSIPLSGSATVEIVDNSKDFADVPPESWAADAVDFASAHELFSGTSETTFSPDQPMSRGMLATVLYRLEGSPDQGLTDLFNDASSGAWYEEGVAWAVESGIAGGCGDDQLGSDDSITREQFVVMLWRYAGSPEAGSQVLDFVDADQVSSFALEALCWAVENGILRGVGNGMLDPGGTATRAQAAQLLKNFMEST